MNESTSETTDGVTDRAMGGESDGFYETESNYFKIIR